MHKSPSNFRRPALALPRSPSVSGIRHQVGIRTVEDTTVRLIFVNGRKVDVVKLSTVLMPTGAGDRASDRVTAVIVSWSASAALVLKPPILRRAMTCSRRAMRPSPSRIELPQIWILPVVSNRRENILFVGGERVLKRPDDHWSWGGFANEWHRTPSVR
jgi:hypothetical protein